MSNKNQSSGGGPGVISRSLFGGNHLGGGFGNNPNSSESASGMRVQDSGREDPVAKARGTCRDALDEVAGRRSVARKESDVDCAIRDAEYIASFPVTGEGQDDKSEYIKQHLLELNGTNKTRPVRLFVSLSGIKVCCRTGETVYMAHALKRISYATCHPDQCQFSFLAREPKAQTNVQYCHAFSTRTSVEAEELNAVVANAFKLAYDGQRNDPSTVTADVGGSVNHAPARTAAQPQHDIYRGQVDSQPPPSKDRQTGGSKQTDSVISYQSSPVSNRCGVADRTAVVVQKTEQKQKELSEFELMLHSNTPSRESTPPMTNASKQSLRTVASSSQLTRKQSSADSHVSRSHSDINNRISPMTSSHPLNGSCVKSPGGIVDAGMESNEQILAAIIATLKSGEFRTHGSPVTIFKEVIDEYFKNNVLSAMNGCYSPMRTLGHFESNRPSPHKPQAAKKLLESLSHRSGNWQPAVSPDTSNGISRNASQRSAVKPTIAQLLGSEISVEAGSRSSWASPSTDVPGRLRQTNPVSESPMAFGAKTKGGERGGAESVLSSSQSSASLRIIGGEDDRNLHQAAWYQPGLQREIALEMLSRQETGFFLVRDSTTHPGYYALSIKVSKQDNANGITHFLIMKTNSGSFKIKGLCKEWSSLTALVTHHTVMKELLPCILIMPNFRNPGFNREELMNY